MAKRQSDFDDLIDTVAKLPWWVGVLLALVSFVGLHLVAGMEIAVPKGMQGLGDNIARQIVKTIGMFGQYLLPIAFLAGAAVSAFGQAKRDNLRSHPPSSFDEYLQRNNKDGREGIDANPRHEHAEDRIYPIWKSASSDARPAAMVDDARWSAELLAALEWKRFEEVCAGLFERLGFATKAATRGADGGIDICLYQPPSNLPVAVVQCKSWISKVGVKFIRELRGVMASEGVTEGIFATTSTYSDDAVVFASANHIDLMDGKAVINAILKLPEEQQASLLRLATAGDYTTPTCASCGVKLVERKPKLGGKPFWGCVNFPKCKMKIYKAAA